MPVMGLEAMRRRDFVKLLGGAVAFPSLARAQKNEGVRRIGVLGPLPSDDPIEKRRMAAFREGLDQVGLNDGRNLRIEYRANVGGPEELRQYVEELVAQKPDAILVSSSGLLAALSKATRDVPIVFVNVADPVGLGFVGNMARPGGNITGFTPLEFGTSPKWLELLKELKPTINRVAVIREASPGGKAFFTALQSAAPALSVEITAIDPFGPAEIESSFSEFAVGSTEGLVVPAIPSINAYRDLIIGLAAKFRVPAIYAFRQNVIAGGLVSYGPDQFEHYRRAAAYIDRILKGDKPGDLPVQAPTKYELSINLKTAKALGLTVPSSLIARADEVIE
ncbi:MAG: ABC transporter substrate-binding protein [Pseudolabrys sp.]